MPFDHDGPLDAERKSFSPRDRAMSAATRPYDNSTSTSTCSTSTPAAQRARPAATPSDRREKLGAVGRVASRVRTSGIIRLSAAFAKSRDVDPALDVNISPWGVGVAAAPTAAPTPSLPADAPADDALASVVANTSAVSLAQGAADNTRHTPMPAKAELASDGSDLPPDALSPVSVESASAAGSVASAIGVHPLPITASDQRQPIADRARPSAATGPAALSPFTPAVLALAYANRRMAPRGQSSPNMNHEHKPFPLPAAAALVSTSTSASGPSAGDGGPRNKLAKRISRVMFRTDSNRIADVTDRPRPSRDARHAADERPVTNSSSERSSFRSFITGLGKPKHDTNTAPPRDTLEKKSSAHMSRSASVGLVAASSITPGGHAALSEVTDGVRNARLDKAIQGRKSRTWRSRERDESKGRRGKWLHIFSSGQSDHNSKEHDDHDDEHVDDASGSSSTQDREASGGRQWRGKDKKDLSELDFADDEFYDSADDEEPSGDKMPVVPSLARDDFVAYQTSQKRKTRKPRVSLMRM